MKERYSPKYTPMKKSAAARLQTKKRGTSILLRENTRTKTTVPLPNMARRNTIQTPQRKVHQSKRSWHGKNGPVGYRKNDYVNMKSC